MDLLQSLRAALAGRYNVEREIGAGAMARVFVADDFRHHRKVAIKILRPELAESLGSVRFLREIQTAASLQHPHILPLFDSGELSVVESGQPASLFYYTMPFVEGESLRARLRRETQLPVPDAIRIAKAIAAGLDYAHRKHVVHRDLKPENILLHDGQPLIADFGIALALAGTDAERITSTGISVGTPMYMSPEQASGETPVDGRTDIYALGAVLYEMLVGEPPFTGPTAQAVLSRAMTAAPRSIREIRSAVPPALESVAFRAMSKVPADRFATAAEFIAALESSEVNTLSQAKVGFNETSAVGPISVAQWAAFGFLAVAMGAGVWWATGRNASSAMIDADLMAVLPFRVSGPDSSLSYLREGMVDLLNSQLTGDRIPRAVDTRAVLQAWRRVLGTSTTALTVDQSIEIARQLGAGKLLLGEVVGTSAGATMTARVFEVPSGRLIASHNEQGDADEMVTASRLLSRLLAKTLGDVADRVARLSDSTTAVREYLAGLQLYRAGQRRAASRRLAKALEIDSTFASAAVWWTFTQPESQAITDADDALFSVRDRLSARDRALIPTLWSYGPNYPEPSTMSDFLRAYQNAAEADPNRPELLFKWANALRAYGSTVGIATAYAQAAVLLDRAIANDSSFAPAIQSRFAITLEARDSVRASQLAKLFFAATDAGDDGSHFQLAWAFARIFGDSVPFKAAKAAVLAMAAPVVFGGINLVGPSIRFGFSLDDAEALMTDTALRLNPTGRTSARLEIAALRGQARLALILLDSLPPWEGQWVRRPPLLTIALALADPGYDADADSAMRFLATVPDTLVHLRATTTCFAELWRAFRGDTTSAVATAKQLKSMFRRYDTPMLAARVGPLDVCPLLLEAAVEQARPRSSPAFALSRLDSLTRLGTGRDLTGPIANLMIATWLEARGDYTAALAAVRRRGDGGVYHTLTTPAYLRAEGRLAALVGDTAGAIKAYSHYLTIRDRPDSGAMEEEVRRVRTHLAELIGDQSLARPRVQRR